MLAAARYYDITKWTTLFAFITVFYYFYFLKQREATQEKNSKSVLKNDLIFISSSISHSLDTKPLPAIQYRSQTLRIRDSYLILKQRKYQYNFGPINDSDTRHFQAYPRYLKISTAFISPSCFPFCADPIHSNVYFYDIIAFIIHHLFLLNRHLQCISTDLFNKQFHSAFLFQLTAHFPLTVFAFSSSFFDILTAFRP